MPLKPLSHKEVRRKLEAFGFVECGRKGSHIKFMKSTGGVIYTAIVPEHKEIAIGTLRSIIRQAGMAVEEFMDK